MTTYIVLIVNVQMSTDPYTSKKTLSSACGIFAFLFLVPAIGTWISPIDK